MIAKIFASLAATAALALSASASAQSVGFSIGAPIDHGRGSVSVGFATPAQGGYYNAQRSYGPPPLRREFIPVMPLNHVWVPGFWDYGSDGVYRWVPGQSRYIQPRGYYSDPGYYAQPGYYAPAPSVSLNFGWNDHDRRGGWDRGGRDHGGRDHGWDRGGRGGDRDGRGGDRGGRDHGPGRHN